MHEWLSESVCDWLTECESDLVSEWLTGWMIIDWMIQLGGLSELLMLNAVCESQSGFSMLVSKFVWKIESCKKHNRSGIEVAPLENIKK